MGPEEMVKLADWMEAVISAPEDGARLDNINREVQALCAQFPAPGV
jgi:glycine/serine hydroxymethyltransferase